MASDPYLPVLPGSASSGVPGPPMLRQPSYGGEESTLASPGPSVELATLLSRSKTDPEDSAGVEKYKTEAAGEAGQPPSDPVASVAECSEQAAVPALTLPVKKTVCLSVDAPESERREENVSCDDRSLALPFSSQDVGGFEGGTTASESVEDDLKRQIPFGLNRYILAALFALVVLLKGCTYWGWNGFQEMFYKSGAYEWECREGVPGFDQHMNVGGVEYPDCAPRKNSINNIYTVIFCTHFISSAFSGWVLDAAGPKICMLAAVLVEITGWLFFAFSSQAFRAYYAGAVLLGIAADPAYLPLLSVSALFPGNESFIMSIMGSFRSISFAVPVILAKIYISNSIPADNLWIVIVCYVGVGLGFCFIVTFLLVPNKAFQSLSEEAMARRKALRAAEKAEKKHRKRNKTPGEAQHVSGRPDSPPATVGLATPGTPAAAGRPLLQGEDKQGDTAVAGNELKDGTSCSPSLRESEEEEAPFSRFWKCLTSREFLLILPCFLIGLLRAEFYSKSNKEQLIVSTTGRDLYEMFSIVNILSFIPGPLMGKLVDIFGIVFVLALLNVCGILVYVFVMPDQLICKGISIFSYFFYCSFVLSNLYCYVAVNFPSQFFGKLTGFASLVGGVFSLTSLGWYKLSSETLYSWYPRNYLLVDGIMVALGLLNCFIIYGMYDAGRKKATSLRKKEQATEEADAMC